MKSIPLLVCVLVALCLPSIATSEFLNLRDDSSEDLVCETRVTGQTEPPATSRVVQLRTFSAVVGKVPLWPRPLEGVFISQVLSGAALLTWIVIRRK